MEIASNISIFNGYNNDIQWKIFFLIINLNIFNIVIIFKWKSKYFRYIIHSKELAASINLCNCSSHFFNCWKHISSSHKFCLGFSDYLIYLLNYAILAWHAYTLFLNVSNCTSFSPEPTLWQSWRTFLSSSTLCSKFLMDASSKQGWERVPGGLILKDMISASKAAAKRM